MMVYMAAEGHIGLPRFATSGATMDHIVLRQCFLWSDGAMGRDSSVLPAPVT